MGDTEETLFNQVIFSNLTKFFNLQDLKSVRSVCQTWKSLCRLKYQLKAFITFHNSEDIENYLAEGIDIFCNFKIRCSLDQSSETPDERKSFIKFAKLHGKNIRELQFLKSLSQEDEILSYFPNMVILTVDYSARAKAPRRHDYGLGPIYNSNLRILEIIGAPFSGDNESWYGPFVDWNFFMTSFPNVEILGAHCQSSEDLTRCLSVLNATPESWLQLSEFSSALTELNSCHLNMLLNSHQKFSSLYFFVAEDPAALDGTTNILANHHTTLRSLQIYFQPLEESPPLRPFCSHRSVCLPTFTALTSLNMLLDMITSFNFLEFLPNLKHLDLQKVVGAVCDFEEADGSYDHIVAKTHPDLIARKLVRLNFESFLSPRLLEKVAYFFPCLQCLSMYLDDSSLRTVFKTMDQNLQELFILGNGTITDEGITGISLRAFLRKYQYMQDYRSGPYIGNMRRLWRIRMPQPQKRVTDLSVKFGFQSAKSLRSVELSESGISLEGQGSLREDQRLIRIEY